MLRDGTYRNAHAQKASHYHYCKAYPAPKWESMPRGSQITLICESSQADVIVQGGVIPKARVFSSGPRNLVRVVSTLASPTFDRPLATPL